MLQPSLKDSPVAVKTKRRVIYFYRNSSLKIFPTLSATAVLSWDNKQVAVWAFSSKWLYRFTRHPAGTCNNHAYSPGHNHPLSVTVACAKALRGKSKLCEAQKSKQVEMFS
jgi:hypothetical protein